MGPSVDWRSTSWRRHGGDAREQLTIHADRGSAMTSKSVAFLLADLGITKTHSRPHVSNDNPFSEAQFKTLKYRPAFPARFGSIRTPARTATSSSPGTTSNIITAASPC
jgi:putative transposase